MKLSTFIKGSSMAALGGLISYLVQFLGTLK